MREAVDGGLVPAAGLTPTQVAASVAAEAELAKKVTTANATGTLADAGAATIAKTEADAARAATQTPADTTDKKTTAIDQDALALLMNQMNQWGLGSLSGAISKLLTKGMTYDQVMTKIKYDNTVDPDTGQPWNAAYNKRFAGNVARVKQGLNALDEKTYLSQENMYEDTIKSYGLRDMLSTDPEKNHEKWADYMAKGISGEEFGSRIKTAYDEVLNLDPRVKETFQTWYPSLTNQDLVSYFLAPEETIDKLKTKAAAAQIGAAAGMQGFVTDKERAELFSKQGVTYKQAQEAYSNVAEVLPGGKKLSDIYAEEMIQYSQKTAEDEFLGQSAEAKLKRNRLASKERAMFAGQSGVDSGSLTKTNNF
jgi:hypothetical protein